MFVSLKQLAFIVHGLKDDIGDLVRRRNFNSIISTYLNS